MTKELNVQQVTKKVESITEAVNKLEKAIEFNQECEVNRLEREQAPSWLQDLYSRVGLTNQ